MYLQPPQTGSGKFYFKTGATYEGEWMKAPKPEGTEVKPTDAKTAAADQPDAVASQLVRHGKGTLQARLAACAAAHHQQLHTMLQCYPAYPVNCQLCG